MIAITPQLAIPLSELSFTTSRSSGPGGQNVNKVNSRVSLHFSVTKSISLSSFQKSQIMKQLDTRINKEGVLQLHAQAARSQAVNREALLERFAKLLRQSLAIPKIRKRRAIPRRARDQRLNEKKHRGELKKVRTQVRNVDE